MWRYADIRTVPDIIRYWSAAAPQRVALVQGPRQVTYRELGDRSSQIARALLDEGAGRGSHIGFLGRNSAEFFEVWLGATKAGGAIAPFNWRSSPAELVELVQDARPQVVFVSAELREMLEEVRRSSGVVGAPDGKWGEVVTAFVVLVPGSGLTGEDLKAHCRSLIARYKVPKSIHIEPSLPQTPSGKIRKAELRRRLREVSGRRSR